MSFIFNFFKGIFRLLFTLAFLLVAGWLVIVLIFKGAVWLFSTDMMQNYLAVNGHVFAMFALGGLVIIGFLILAFILGI